MQVLYLTREYPPHVYGGAGVHVEHLAREMAHLATVEVKCFGDQQAPFDNPAVHGYPFTEGIFEGNPRRVKQALMTLATCLRFNAAPIEADVV
ncbi:MAG: glycogen synthase, partial [Thermodesulfobacteriota bacterium]